MEKKYDCLKLENQLCFPIYLCSKEIINHYTPMLKEINLTYTQYIVMMYFWENEESNVKELGKTLLLDSSTLTPLLKKLESKGFIKRERSSVDERNLMLSITDEGKKLKEKALEIPKKMGKCLNLSNSEAAELYKLMYKVLINVIKEEKNENN